MKKKVQVVMLPSEDKVSMMDLCTSARQLDTTKPLIFGTFDNAYPEECIKQELYFTSDEEIVKFDYVYSVLYGVGRVISDNNPNYKGETPLLVEYTNNLDTYIPCNTDGTYCNDGKNIYENDCKKIVATTNSKLETIEEKAGDDVWVRALPKIPYSFKESYAKNPVEYVELEYKCAQCYSEDVDDCWSARECSDGKHDMLKLTPNNEVIVHLIEDETYSKDDVESILFQYATEEHAWLSSKDEIEKFNKWIKENL